MAKKIIINIAWEGPFTERQAEDLTNDTDYGIYQFYGRHPIYGMSAEKLLYIGKAQNQTFGNRIKQHTLKEWAGKTGHVLVGRLAGEHQPRPAEWNRYIDEAERLLIFAHAPAWNAQFINDHGKVRNLHIMNWGNYGQLLPEISRERYVHKRHNLPEKYKIF